MPQSFYQKNKYFLLVLVLIFGFFFFHTVYALNPCTGDGSQFAQCEATPAPPSGYYFSSASGSWFLYNLGPTESGSATVCITSPGGGGDQCDSWPAPVGEDSGTVNVNCQNTSCDWAQVMAWGPDFVEVDLQATIQPQPGGGTPVPTVDITCNSTQGPCSINSGNSVSIEWTSTYTDTCNIDGTPVGSSGSSVDILTSSRTYTFTCSGPGGGPVSDSVTVNVTSGGSCSPNQGNSCTSSANSCGMTNSGTIQCDGSCSVSTPSDSLCGPSCVPNVNNSCTSSANSCGMTNSGTIQCDGSCSASIPSNGLCTPSSFTDDATASFSTPIPSSLTPGQVVSFTIRVNDSGNTKWYHGSAYQLIQKSALSISPSYGHLPFVMNPGDSNSWTFNLTAPATSGSYTFNMQMLHYGGWDYIKPDGTSSTGPASNTYFGQIASKTFTVASACVPNQGNSCTSSANSCGMTNSGTIQCDGSCSASTPPDSSCAPSGPPSINNVIISSQIVKTDSSTPYNIVITSTDPSAGGNILEQYVLINEGGTNAGQYRGYLGWYNGNVWTGIKDYQACLGGGYAGIHDYGQYIELDSCSTSVSGTTRTNIFTIRFNPAFTTPVTNNDISGLTGNSNGRNAIVPGNATYWTNFDINFGLFVSSLPDLVASAPPQTTATVGVAQTYTSTITNNGTAGTGASFVNLFQTSPSSTGASGVVDYPVSPNMSALGAGGSAGASQSITFTTATSPMYVRACADKSSAGDVNGTISESNDGNNCSAWMPVTVSSSPTCAIAATGDGQGGTISNITVGGTNYRVHTFTSSAQSPFVAPTSAGCVEYLVVGGGGGGGSFGGGGGAGGFRTGDLSINEGQSYPITVGTGGSGAPGGSGAVGSNGSNSIFSSITSTGGGGGAGNALSANNGGSGGGGSNGANFGTGSQGSNGGGAGSATDKNASGGGGAGGAGITNTNNNLPREATGVSGGNGAVSSINGSAVTYAGGGGSGGSSQSGVARGGGSGGSGGGGNGGGSLVANIPTPGSPNTGGGGGGGGYNGLGPGGDYTHAGGAGGSGIVIIRYPLSDPMNYSLSNSGNSNVTKTTGNAFTQNTITKSLISGATQAVTLSLTGVPTGTSYSISNSSCSPTCTSVVTFTVTPSTQVGTYPITVTGSPLNKQTTFNLVVSGSAMSVTCTAIPSPALIGQVVTWTANVSGGTPPFLYSWSGTSIPSSPAPNTNPFNISYSTIGQKNASVTVTDSDSVQATCVPAGIVQINFNPIFEEF